MEHLRYTIRKETFGGLIYDHMMDGYILIDENFYDVLKRILLDNRTKDILTKEQLTMLEKEGLFVSGIPMYEIRENPIKKGILSSPVRVHFCYTYDCNLNCKHCFTKLQNKGEAELSFNEKIEMLDQMRLLGISEILVGGGEPFMKGDLLEFISECNKRNINIKIFSNGLLLTDEIIQELSLKNLKYLSISVDGGNVEDYKNVRKSERLFEIVQNIKKIKKTCNFDVAMSVTVNNNNKNNIEGLLSIARESGVDRIKIRPTKPSGNVLINPEIYMKAEEYLIFLREIVSLWCTNYKNDFKVDISWGDTRIEYDETEHALKVVNNPFPYEGYGCFAGKGSIVIRANGDVSPCGFLPEKMQITRGVNIREKTIKEIWDTSSNFSLFRNMKGNITCKECNYYLVCRGGCIARILYAGKGLNEKDPWCLKKYFPAKI